MKNAAFELMLDGNQNGTQIYFEDNLRKHCVIFLLIDISDGLLEYHADRIDDNIYLAKVLQDFAEQVINGTCCGQIGRIEGHFEVRIVLLEVSSEPCCVIFGFGRVVMQGQAASKRGQL